MHGRRYRSVIIKKKKTKNNPLQVYVVSFTCLENPFAFPSQEGYNTCFILIFVFNENTWD